MGESLSTMLKKQKVYFTGFIETVKPSGFYRPDIDGLRAIAVLSVCAYHFASSTFPGGFIGVDIFFVISGYLITSILYKSVDQKEFSGFGRLLSDFYQRRIRRIFPVLIVVILACLMVGWLVLFPSEYARLGKHIAGGAGYVENFILWAESGYFDQDAVRKPLLHLWSLAVEEQFYIFWPFVLWFVMRRRWPLMATIGAIATLSFSLNIYLIWTGSMTDAFYFPITRVWELMVGAGLAIAHRRQFGWTSRWAGLQAWLGLLLIVIGFAVITPDKGFPGFWALLPVGGTALLINSGPSGFLNGKLLSWRPAVWIGLISYTLYLWHYALMSMTVVVFGRDLPHLVIWERKFVLAGVSLLLAWLTYRYFEQPIRRSRKVSTSVIMCGVVALLGLCGLGVYVGSGLQSRPMTLIATGNDSYYKSIAVSPARHRCYELNEKPGWPERWSCELGDVNADKWVLANGDSHSLSMIPALDHYGKMAGVKVVYAGQGGCLSLLGVYRDRSDKRSKSIDCMVQAQNVAKLAKTERPSAVIQIQRWSVAGVGGQIRPDETNNIRVATLAKGVLTKTKIVGTNALKYSLNKTLAYYQSLHIPVLIVEDTPQQLVPIPMAKSRFNSDVTSKDFNASAVTLKQHRRDQEAVNHILEAAAAKYGVARILNLDSALCNARICPWVENGKFLYVDDDHLSITGSMKVYGRLAEKLNRILSLVAR